MSYVEEKTRIAMRLARGDKAQAIRILCRMAGDDEKLLAELARPFLWGIADHAVRWTARRLPKPGSKNNREEEKRPRREKGMADLVMGALNDRGERHSLTSGRPAAPLGRKTAGRSHESAMQALVKAQKMRSDAEAAGAVPRSALMRPSAVSPNRGSKPPSPAPPAGRPKGRTLGDAFLDPAPPRQSGPGPGSPPSRGPKRR